MTMGIQNVLVSAGLVVTGLKSITSHLRFRSALSRLRVAEVQKTCNDLQLSYTCACFISHSSVAAQRNQSSMVGIIHVLLERLLRMCLLFLRHDAVGPQPPICSYVSIELNSLIELRVTQAQIAFDADTSRSIAST